MDFLTRISQLFSKRSESSKQIDDVCEPVHTDEQSAETINKQDNMTEVSAEDELTAEDIMLLQHQSARFSLVPYLAKTLLGQTPSTKGGLAIPVQNAEVLTAEAVEALGEVCRQGVWASLLRHYGWQRAWYAVLAQDNEQQSRLWEASHLAGFELTFSPAAIDAAIAAFNIRLGKRKVDDVVMVAVQRESWQKNGDILLGLWLYLQNHASNGQANKDSSTKSQDDDNNDKASVGVAPGYNNNPLVLMESPELLPHDAKVQEQSLSALPRLMQSDLSPLLPWLMFGWSKHWIQAEPTRWLGQTKFQAYSNAQHQVWNAWLDELDKQDRPDLAEPLMHYFIGLMPGMGSLGDSLLRRFDKLTGSMRLQERREIAEPWLAVLQISQRLVDLEQRCRQMHPIERECTHRLYLDRFQALEYDCIHKEILSVIDSVAPTIG